MIRYIKLGLCVFFALFFVLAGVSHFLSDDKFAAIVPPFLPFPYFIVWVTGIIEAILAIMLIIPRWRALAGLIFAPYLLAVLPANIYMALAGIGFTDDIISPQILWFRVALQFPLIALIAWASDAKDAFLYLKA